MRTNRLSPGRLASALAFMAVLVMAGYAGAEKATVLEYKVPTGRALSYQDSSESAQVLDIMGQTVEISTKSAITISFKGKGLKEKNLLLGVTIDDMTMSITSTQGDMSPDLNSLKGKSFDMVLSPLGSEVDVSGAEAITYDLTDGTRNLAADFKMFFPDLPGKSLKVGDTWPSSAGVNDKKGGIETRSDLAFVNTLVGFETVDGMACAKISSQVTGTVSGSGNQMGQDLTFSGTLKGTDIWYFAVKEALLVKSTTDRTTEMSIDVSSAGMTIPATLTQKSETKLIGKS
jgi:hypothetical protein